MSYDSVKKTMEALSAMLSDFKDKTAKVGVLGGSYQNGEPIAYIAAIQEYGVPSKGIPSRSFMRSTVAEEKDQWAENIQAGVRAVVRNEISAEQVLDQVGAVAAGDIRQTISQLTEPPLKESTIKARVRRTASGERTGSIEKPLIDTGVLLQSISHKVD